MGWGGALEMVWGWKRDVLCWWQKENIEQLLRMSKGREFQIVGAATEKLLEPIHVRTQGIGSRLVWDECNVWADDDDDEGVKCNVHEQLMLWFIQVVRLWLYFANMWQILIVQLWLKFSFIYLSHKHLFYVTVFSFVFFFSQSHLEQFQFFLVQITAACMSIFQCKAFLHCIISQWLMVE